METPFTVAKNDFRGGKHLVKEIREIHQKILDFQWNELIQLQGSTNLTPHGPTQPEAKRQMQAAIRLVRCGELSRAARVLTSKGLAPANDTTVERLKKKHPANNNDSLAFSTCADNQIQLTRSSLSHVIRQSPRGSAAGISGWRYEHLRLLLDNVETNDGLYIACSKIAEGNIPDSIASLLSASRLIALPKANGDVRPVAIVITMRRITASAICLQKKPALASFFVPIQHGVATEGGPELIIHHVQLLMEEHPDWVVVKSDISNAFNSVDRRHLLNEISATLPELSGHVGQMYVWQMQFPHLHERTGTCHIIIPTGRSSG